LKAKRIAAKNNEGRGRLAVGLMSGTSMDGIDAALVRISGMPEKPRVRLLAFLTQPFPDFLRENVLKVAGGKPTTACELSELNSFLGGLFALPVVSLCTRSRLAPSRLSVIGSHGQTIYHQGSPTKGSSRSRGRGASTLQIGEAAVIASFSRVPVVADFRQADMAAGGEGAPLVPMVDFLLLRHEREGRVALNIGGIANITVIPAGAKPEDVLGFDTGPGNIVIDALVRHFTRGRKSHDVGGRLADRGKVIEPLLARLLRLPFFRRKPPKSAGRRQFGDWFVKEFFLKRRAKREDLLRTATELTTRTIAQALERFVFPQVKIRRLIVSGGGAHNRLLMRRLCELLPHLAVCLSDQYGLPVDAKEAIAFAVLADRTMHGLPGNLPSVTGAERPAILGKIVLP
jgi:anhydro-N-acetylmuramic acid kinase